MGAGHHGLGLAVMDTKVMCCSGWAPCGPFREEVEHQPPCLPKSLSTAKLAPGFAQSLWMAGDSARLQETEAFFRETEESEATGGSTCTCLQLINYESTH